MVDVNTQEYKNSFQQLVDWAYKIKNDYDAIHDGYDILDFFSEVGNTDEWSKGLEDAYNWTVNWYREIGGDSKLEELLGDASFIDWGHRNGKIKKQLVSALTASIAWTDQVFTLYKNCSTLNDNPSVRRFQLELWGKNMQSLHYAPDEIVVFLEDIRRTPMNKSYRQKRYIKVSTEQQDVQLLLQWGDIADKYYGKVKDIYELLVAARKKGDADLWSDGLDMCNDLLNETWGNVATNADYSNVADAAERLGGYEKYNLQSKIRQTLSSVADWKNQLKDLSGLTDPLGSDPQEERSELEWLFQNLSLMQYASDDIGDFIDDALEGGNMYG